MNISIKKNSQRGFTLVEVIVVAIIVAALAAVAIPLYNGYIKSSRNNAAANAAGSVASFMGACVNQSGAVTGVTTAKFSGPDTVICTFGTPPATTQITVPTGISMTITNLSGSGQVKASSGDSTAAEQVYSY